MKTEVFDNADPNWTDYGTLRLQLKNLGKAPLRLNEVRLYTGEVSYYTPVCNESGLAGVTVPADGEWHTVSFDLNRLLFMGAGAEKTNEKLLEVANAEFLMDDIRVTPGADGEAPAKTFRGVVEYLKALFAAFADMLRAFFGARA